MLAYCIRWLRGERSQGAERSSTYVRSAYICHRTKEDCVQHKITFLFTILVLLSLVTPAGPGPARAQAGAQGAPPACPPYEEGILREKDLLASVPPDCIRMYKEADREAGPHAARAADVETMAFGGPDQFGYTYNDSVAFSWINAATNSGLTGDDAFTGPISIGFNFPFYGTAQSQLYFNTNGLITFGAGSSEWGAYRTPTELNPNNLIAAFWDDLLVGSSYNNGAVYYSRGGSAPNRYFVVEWRNVQNYEDGITPFSFEAILHENGDVVIQHKSLPVSYYATVGIEDSSGYQGLQYHYGTSGLSTPRAIRFFYPAPAQRVLAYPIQQGGFAPLNGHKDFQVVVTNTGSLGTDTYNLRTAESYWPVTYYAANGVTPLTDTDGDEIIDTGPIAQGASTIFIARYSAPIGLWVGFSNYATIYINSAWNFSVGTSVELRMTIPAGFATVFQSESNGAMSFFTASADGTKLSKATSDNYFGYDAAVAQLPNGNYFYAWDRTSAGVGNIEYALLNPSGAIVRAPARLTNNTGGSLSTLDTSPSISVTPNGIVGVVWRRYLYNTVTSQFNYNIFFATLNSAGALLTGPTSITNNTLWSTSSSNNILRFYGQTIAANTDNRFVIGWEDNQQVNSSTLKYNVWYAVRNAAGNSILAPTALTSDDMSWGPVLNSLSNGDVIITWLTDVGGPYFQIIHSSGALDFHGRSLESNAIYYSIDAAQLPNGETVIAWTTDTGVEVSFLDFRYDLRSGPYDANSPGRRRGRNISVTADPSNRAILTWVDGESFNKQLYALVEGSFIITQPIVYNTSRSYIDVTWRGQATAPYRARPVISGHTNLALNSTVSYTGGSVTTGEYGIYSFTVPFGWSGTVTPSNPDYVFSPQDRSYTNVTTDQPHQDYTPIRAYFISGNAGAAGVTLSYMDDTPRTITSQADGSYSFRVPSNWSGTVTPNHPCFTFSPASQSYTSLGGNQTTQGYTPSLDTSAGCADVSVGIGGTLQGRFGLPGGASTRASFTAVNNGPVQIESTNAVQIMGAERLIYKVKGVNTSFTEMMALPDKQLDNMYWLPWYNNVDLDTQLRIANVSGSQATITVTIGGVPRPSFNLAAGGSTRVSYAGVNSGPVKIVSTQNIVAAERVIYKINNIYTSFSEMMALPAGQLSTTYWLPWYNNVDLDTQLRIANVSDQPATVTVTIGDVEMAPIELAAGESTRVSYAGVNDGPVQIQSTQNIVAAERVIYKINNVNTSFTEMMALPAGQLSNTYWLPWYNNVDLDTQLRFANTTDQTATVHVYIGGQEMGTGFTLQPGESTRQSFTGINAGPVQIVSTQNIVAAERVIYRINNVNTSFSEMMGLPAPQLDTTYWLPWYNNVDLDTQLRFGVP
jgi:hypothetical protein